MIPLLSLDEFEIEGRVGGGTYANVFEAIRKDNGQRFALKKVKYFSNVPGIPFEFIREIKSMHSINNSNIIHLNGIIANEKSREIYAVLDYYKYDLSELIHGGYLRNKCKDYIRIIFSQIASGLNAIHQSGYMHRDIKPANILINDEGKIVICDLGLCRRVIPSTRYSSNVEALPYRAPEVYKNSYNQKIDVWSLGCVLFELCTHQLLFEPKPNDISMAGELAHVCNVPIECITNAENSENQNLDKCTIEKIKCKECSECYDLLAHMLVINPEKRYSMEDIMKHPYVSENTKTTIEINGKEIRSDDED
ncbi:CMGC family protein kinase [Trichomonas vaginalis G3]|uniref:CMGC family protein kinase n=1 Tax=Trichomonas vaginalis (strain ATCC PRA-98 / G3) TaxID=412133 RepID=A2G1U4_TRIV3|nr:cyclin-dependent protein serine/threonine kinase protein [Trichomonas vaginalis G3]EAX88872.1 CMGC family protein kinase [Trichomonas vaginalis G3]KAI5495146.1 cyclin-dependent protein serine/threonine kinase protein [Trichomonas vaginalis G3]|eukprot:XP_001301802.1 CMGC family protein kinase [Trichomonas vaginalis G3]